MRVDERQRIEPAHLWIPPTAAATSGSAGDAADLAASAGLVLDLEQRLALEVLLAEEASGRWAAFEAAIIAARQNMKTATFLAVALLKLFLHQDRKTVWTAHEFPTALEAFTDMQALIDGASHLSRRVKKINNTNGEEGIELHSGAKLIFRARSKGAGRGLSGNTLILDEALFLRPAHVGSLLPILSAVPNSQVLYGSSAGVLMSGILRAIRDRGRAGGDPSLGYIEWCAPVGGCAEPGCTHRLSAVGCALDDEVRWQMANPALGRRITHRAIRAERRALPPVEFARERLGWWEDPVGEDQAGVIDMATWGQLADTTVEIGDAPVFGLDVDIDRMATIAAAWRREDGAVQVSLIEPAIDAYRAAESCQALTEKWGGRVMVPRAFGEEFAAAGAPVEVVKPADMNAASGAFVDATIAKTLWHDDDDALNDAVAVAQWAPGRAADRSFDLRLGRQIRPMLAVVRALHGLSTATSAYEDHDLVVL